MYTVVAQRTIAAPREQVWRYLTEPTLLARWFADTERFDRDAGAFRFDFGDGDFFTGQVTDWEPNICLEVNWKFVDMGPSYRVHFSVLPRKKGTEVSVQDRGALTLDEAECLRVGWSEFLMRLDKAICQQQNARFKWRKAITFTCGVNDRLASVMKTLADPDWYAATFQDGHAAIEAIKPDRVQAVYSTRQWSPGTTNIRIKHERLPGRGDYLFVAHEGWRTLPQAHAEAERKRYVQLWLDGLSSITN